MNTLSSRIRASAIGIILLCGLAGTLVNAAWVDVTSTLVNHTTACGTTYCVAAVPNQNKVITGLCGDQGLFATTDNGASWQAMGTSTNWIDPQTVFFDQARPDTFWEVGIYGSLIHRTYDGGATFTTLPAGSSDGIGIDMTDPQRKTIVVGSHESTGISKSTDGGATWTNITNGMSGWTKYPVVYSPQIFIMGCQNTGGIYRTTNGGTNWTQVSALVPSYNPLIASDGSVYFVDNAGGGILKSSDQGLTWTRIAKQGVLAGDYPAVELPDHSIVVVSSSGLVSWNGTTWATVTDPLPPSTTKQQSGMAYNSVSHSFYISYWVCETALSAGALWKFDYATPVVNATPPQKNARGSSGRATIVLASNGRSTPASSPLSQRYDLRGRILSGSLAGEGISIVRLSSR